ALYRGALVPGRLLAPALDDPAPALAAAPAAEAAVVGARRDAYFGPEHGWRTARILARADLAEPQEGPCIVEEYDATCVVPPGAVARLDAAGCIVVDL
ncbi:MAG: hydantoinase/oxoprolinase family protein, partial [Alphaproteobacteria bacterium]